MTNAPPHPLTLFLDLPGALVTEIVPFIKPSFPFAAIWTRMKEAE